MFHLNLKIQLRRQKVHEDPHEAFDRDHRRLHDPQQPLARKASEASGQERHGPRRLNNNNNNIYKFILKNKSPDLNRAIVY